MLSRRPNLRPDNEMSAVTFAGVLPAVTTPFDPEGDVDEAAVRGNARALINAGCHGLVANGTMGEGASLTAQERRVVIETLVDEAAGVVPVIAGSRLETASAVLGNVELASAAGAVAVMCLPPSGYAADDRELETFFAAVADASDLPIILYNNPSATKVDMLLPLLADMAERMRPRSRR